jgi:CBS domain-containing protein
MTRRPVVADYMSTNLRSIAPEATLVAARQLMIDAGVRHLPVLVEDGRLAGVVCERDLYMASAFLQLDPHVATVAIAMTPRPHCIDAGMALAEAAAELDRRRISSALVTDADGRVVGIFTESDATRALAAELGVSAPARIAHAADH